METDKEVLASRYARALLACSEERGVDFTDPALAVSLGSFAACLDKYKRYLYQATPDLYERLLPIFNVRGCSFQLMIKLLTAHKRLELFPAVVRHFFEYYKRKHQIIFCEIKSSHCLTDEQANELAQFIERETGKQTLFSRQIDRGLIAGVRIEGDTMMWERSVAKQLRAIEQLR